MESMAETLRNCGAILAGHFVLSSERHSGEYIDKVKIYKEPVIFEDFCWGIAQEVYQKFRPVDVVAGLAPIGAVIAQRVAYHLGEIRQKRVVPLFAEKDEAGKYFFGRGFDQDLRGKNVLVADDNLTTGHSVRQVIDLVINSGGNVLGVAVFCNRGDVLSDDLYHLPIISLLKVKMDDWPQDNCPLCLKRVPINRDISRGREFLEAHPGYPSI